MTTNRRVIDLLRELRNWGRCQGLGRAVWNRFIARRLPGEYHRVFLRGVPGAVYLRRSGSDWSVFRQLFTAPEYDLLLSIIGGVSTVVDGGANIGLATIAIKRLSPNARVVAIEPDAGNFKVLEKNLAKYGDSVSLLRRAIWDSSDSLNVVTGSFRDGAEWATVVNENACVHGGSGNQTVEALTLSRLLSDFELTNVDLLKLDIEGAETRVFRQPELEWMRHVSTLAVELHPDSPEGDPTDIFFEVFSGDWVHFTVGEMNVATRVELSADLGQAIVDSAARKDRDQ